MKLYVYNVKDGMFSKCLLELDMKKRLYTKAVFGLKEEVCMQRNWIRRNGLYTVDIVGNEVCRIVYDE